MSPIRPLLESVKQINEGLVILEGFGAVEKMENITVERSWFVSYLLNSSFQSFGYGKLIADRLLDAVLADGLLGNWNQSAWATGMEQLEAIRAAALAVET